MFLIHGKMTKDRASGKEGFQACAYVVYPITRETHLSTGFSAPKTKSVFKMQSLRLNLEVGFSMCGALLLAAGLVSWTTFRTWNHG